MTYDAIISELRALTIEDFQYNDTDVDGLTRLRQLTDELRRLPAPERAIPELFAVIERLPESDLGTPGPLVHTLESLSGYESELVASIRRFPASLSVWMLNRILNLSLSPDKRAKYLDLLRDVMDHPTAPETAKDDAELFLEHQEDRIA